MTCSRFIEDRLLKPVITIALSVLALAVQVVLTVTDDLAKVIFFTTAQIAIDLIQCVFVCKCRCNNAHGDRK